MSKLKTFLFGLDRAGKSVVATYLTKGVVDTNTRPTLAFNTSLLIHPKVQVDLWDTPGQIKFRKLWYDKVSNAKLLLFVLDTSDSNRFEEAKKELTDFIKGLYNLNAPLIFCFHQLDKPEAQGNLAKAKAFFDLENIHIKEIYPIETSIKDLASLEKLRQLIFDLAIKRDIEDEKIAREREERAKELAKK
jgi:small GTP-binding protein